MARIARVVPPGVQVWAYCLMQNHVHLVAVPPTEESLALALGKADQRYRRRVNFREGWRAHLWQGRFASFPMDDAHLWVGVRYVELNPVRARLVAQPDDYPWSSARAHLAGRDDRLVRAAPLVAMFGDWGDFLAEGLSAEQAETFRRHERTGRPLGSAGFLARFERTPGRLLRPRKRGPKGPWKHKRTRSRTRSKNQVRCPRNSKMGSHLVGGRRAHTRSRGRPWRGEFHAQRERRGKHSTQVLRAAPPQARYDWFRDAEAV